MVTQQELDRIIDETDTKPREILVDTLAQLRSISEQGLWKTRSGEYIAAEEIDIDTVEFTVLSLYAGDYAVFCEMSGEEGISDAVHGLFNRYARSTVRLVRDFLTSRRREHPKQCTELINLLQTELKDYWT